MYNVSMYTIFYYGSSSIDRYNYCIPIIGMLITVFLIHSLSINMINVQSECDLLIHNTNPVGGMTTGNCLRIDQKFLSMK